MQNRQYDFIDFIEAAYTGNKVVVIEYLEKNKLNIKNYQATPNKSDATHLKFANWQLSLITIAKGAYVKQYEHIAKIILDALEIQIKTYKYKEEYEDKMEDMFYYRQMEFLHRSSISSYQLGVFNENLAIYQTLCEVFDIHPGLCESPGGIIYKDHANQLSIREFYHIRLFINKSNLNLSIAVEKNDLEAVQKYIQENNVNTLSEQRKTEVHLILSSVLDRAIVEGNAAIVKVLVDAGADVNSNHVHPALITAARSGNLEIVDIFLAWPNIKVDILNYARQTALMCASRHGHTVIVKKLLDAGAKVNIQDEFGLTALIHTILYDKQKEHDEVIKLLLSVEDIDLSLTCEMINKEEKGTAFIIAIHQHHVNAVKALIEKGVNVNEMDEFSKNTPLILAAEYAASFSFKGKYSHLMGNMEILAALLDVPSINLFAKNKAGLIAYQVIAEKHASPEVQQLRDYALRLVKNAMRLKATVRGSSSVLFPANANEQKVLPSISNDAKQSLGIVNK